MLKRLTPIPYKIVTVTPGFAGYNRLLFVAFSVITRGLRCFATAFLLRHYGDQARHIIEKQLGLWALLFAIVLVRSIVVPLYLI